MAERVYVRLLFTGALSDHTREGIILDHAGKTVAAEEDQRPLIHRKASRIHGKRPLDTDRTCDLILSWMQTHFLFRDLTFCYQLHHEGVIHRHLGEASVLPDIKTAVSHMRPEDLSLRKGAHDHRRPHRRECWRLRLFGEDRIIRRQYGFLHERFRYRFFAFSPEKILCSRDGKTAGKLPAIIPAHTIG